MDAREFEVIESILRRVVREELAARESGSTPVTAVVTAIREPELTDRSPFLLNDAELRSAERMLPIEEQPILRKRVMAARLESLGNRAGADKMRRAADQMEKQLKRSAA